jgi:hypothetical protein
LQKLIVLIIPVFIASCATSGPVAARWPAEESVIPGLPVPAGSLAQSQFDGGGGVLMAFYAHPRLEGREVLRFYAKRMPDWGWTAIRPAASLPRQLSFEREEVPVLIGVETLEDAEPGSRFNIIRGARGDWGFMPQLRESP